MWDQSSLFVTPFRICECRWSSSVSAQKKIRVALKGNSRRERIEIRNTIVIGTFATIQQYCFLYLIAQRANELSKNHQNPSICSPGPLEADAEGGTAKRNKAVLRRCERRINLDNTVTDVVVAITADDLVAARGRA